jgi:menaquinone-dependent protoporphyrinogen oxidase
MEEIDMGGKILIAYASKRGATAGIAERMAVVLRDGGLQVDALPVDRVGDVAGYDAVVLGSAVYFGRWRKEAASFLKANETALAVRPVWLFSSGPTGEGGAFLKGADFPGALQPIADRIGARGTVVFWGCVDMGSLNPLEKMAMGKTSTPIGDFRDWGAIEAWAGGIAAELAEGGTRRTNGWAAQP